MDQTTKPTAPEQPDAAAKPAFWAVLPAAVRYDEELPPNAKLLYAEISALTDQCGYCYASNEYFMRLYNLGERTIRRLLSELQRAGYIAIADGDGGKDRRKIYAGINPLASNPAKNGREPGQNFPGNPAKNGPHNKKENKKKNNHPKAPQGAESAPSWKPERFAGLWQYYPRHTSKQAAVKAWDKLKPSDELIAEIGKALRRQKASDEWKRGIGVPYLSTYLNNGRWSDEPDVPPDNEPAQAGRKDLVQL